MRAGGNKGKEEIVHIHVKQFQAVWQKIEQLSA